MWSVEVAVISQTVPAKLNAGQTCTGTPRCQLSPSLPLLLLLLSPHVLQILSPTNLGTASLLHHDAGELVVLHGSVIKVLLVPVAPLVVTER